MFFLISPYEDIVVVDVDIVILSLISTDVYCIIFYVIIIFDTTIRAFVV